jgi:hypothetical protein
MAGQTPVNRIFNEWVAQDQIDDGIGAAIVPPKLSMGASQASQSSVIVPTAPMGQTTPQLYLEERSRVQRILQLTSILDPGVKETDFAHKTLHIVGQAGPFKGYIASEDEAIQWWCQLDAAICHRGGYDEKSIIEIL